MTLRAKDYAALGVPETWILDPETREVFVQAKPDGLRQVATGMIFVAGRSH